MQGTTDAPKHVNPQKASIKYRQYSPTAMTNAYLSVKEGHLNMNQASIQYHVPEPTLRHRLSGLINPEATKSGPSPLFTIDQECRLAKHLTDMSTFGYGYSRSEVVNTATDYAVSLGLKVDNTKSLSLKWFYGFMSRWPQLSVIKPRSLDILRARATSPAVINSYFLELESILKKYDLVDKPQCIYNIDEKGLQTNHSPLLIVGTKGTAPPAITSSRSSTTTIIGCGNAYGVQIPPYFVFSGKRMRQELLNGCSPGADGEVSESGWSNTSVFQNYLENHFLKYAQGRNDGSQHLLLLYDGHKSHISISVIEWAKQHNIILFILPAHTSHLLQPMDVACFGPLQRIYNSECQKFMRLSPGASVTRNNICQIACKAYIAALSPENLKSAFRRTGIYPLNPNVISEDTLAPSAVFSNVQHASSTQYASAPASEPTATATNPVPSDCVNDESQLDNLVENFFETREVTASKSATEKQPRKTLSVITSGMPITEPSTQQKIQEHIEQQSSKRTTKSKLDKKQVTAQKPKKRKLQASEPKPGPSGLQTHVTTTSDISSDDDSQDIIDQEKCCVCKHYYVKEAKHCVSLVFTSWAQCDFDGCKHWVHLKFCSKTRVIRRSDVFYCPCHPEDGVQGTEE